MQTGSKVVATSPRVPNWEELGEILSGSSLFCRIMLDLSLRQASANVSHIFSNVMELKRPPQNETAFDSLLIEIPNSVELYLFAGLRDAI